MDVVVLRSQERGPRTRLPAERPSNSEPAGVPDSLQGWSGQQAASGPRSALGRPLSLCPLFSPDLLRGQEEPASPPRGATQPRSQTPPHAHLPARGRASPPAWCRLSSLMAHRGEKCVSSLDSVPCLGPFVRTHSGGDRPCLRGHGPALLSPNWSDTPTPAPLLGPRCFASNPRARASTAESGLCSRLGPQRLLSCPLARWDPAGCPGVSLASLETAPQAEEQAGPGAQPVLAQVELGDTFLPVAQGLAGRGTKLHSRILVQVREAAPGFARSPVSRRDSGTLQKPQASA